MCKSLAALAFKGGYALTLERRRARIEHMRAECLKEVEALPGPNECVFLIMNRTWTMADLVPVAYKLGGQITRMTIFTLGWSRQTLAAIIEAAAKVRDLNFKYMAEGKGATVTARFGPDGITLCDPNRAGEGVAKLFQKIYDRAI